MQVYVYLSYFSRPSFSYKIEHTAFHSSPFINSVVGGRIESPDSLTF